MPGAWAEFEATCPDCDHVVIRRIQKTNNSKKMVRCRCGRILYAKPMRTA